MAIRGRGTISPLLIFLAGNLLPNIPADLFAINLYSHYRRNFLSTMPFLCSQPLQTGPRKRFVEQKGEKRGKKGDEGRTRAINKHRGKSVIPYRLCILRRRLTIKEKFLRSSFSLPSRCWSSFSCTVSPRPSSAPLANRMSPPDAGGKSERSLSRVCRQGCSAGYGS